MPLLEVHDLSVVFHTDQGTVNAVDGVSFGVPEGSTVGLVGESGCGKSVTALSIMRLLAPTAEVRSGRILLRGEDLLEKTEEEICDIRGNKISMIFQDPMTSLNPVYTTGTQIMEAVSTHRAVSRDEAYETAMQMLTTVGIPDARSRMGAYPHQLSGGLRQRVMIAMALACNPDLIIADEPTTALDVTIQAQILRLIRSVQEDRHMSVIMITHDLGVVAEMADQVCVMYAGQIVERADVYSLFKRPLHPYTTGLLGSRPYVAAAIKPERLTTIRGTVPNMLRVPAGCRFAPRCESTSDICRASSPSLADTGDGHLVRCHKWSADSVAGGVANG
jgi:oligopeptide/dipeptide ABC transporter ATP-binding protein